MRFIVPGAQSILDSLALAAQLVLAALAALAAQAAQAVAR